MRGLCLSLSTSSSFLIFSRSLIQETYHSYKAILEQCMNFSMAELDKRQHRKELAIMERLEEIDNTKRHLEMSLLWNEKNNTDGHRNNVGKVISDRMESLMKYRQVKPSPVITSSFIFAPL